jgi:hypothetical protein
MFFSILGHGSDFLKNKKNNNIQEIEGLFLKYKLKYL